MCLREVNASLVKFWAGSCFLGVWELTAQVPLSLGGDIFMMCRTIVQPILHWFLEVSCGSDSLHTLYNAVEKLCFTLC